FCAECAGHKGSGDECGRAEQQLAACRTMVGLRHGHLRWYYGAISNKVKAWGLVSAPAMARRVSAEASGPRAPSATTSGSSPGPTRWAKVLAMSSRCPNPSSQVA